MDGPSYALSNFECSQGCPIPRRGAIGGESQAQLFPLDAAFASQLRNADYGYQELAMHQCAGAPSPTTMNGAQ
jgi:hypothetical protein